MTWRRRKHRQPPKEARMPTTDAVAVHEPPAPPEPADMARAQAAVQLGEASLQEAVQRRPQIDELAAKVRKLNRENGFADMIHRAFGS
jgi:hypothetical protein